MKKIIPLFIVLLSSCTVNKELTLINENPQNHTLTYSFKYNRFEKVNVNFQEIQIKANTKCIEWGFDNALFKKPYFISDRLNNIEIVYECECVKYDGLTQSYH